MSDQNVFKRLPPAVIAAESAQLSDEWVDAGRATALEDPSPSELAEFDEELTRRCAERLAGE